MELGNIVKRLHVGESPLCVLLELFVVSTITIQRSLPLVNTATQLLRIHSQQERPDQLAIDEALEAALSAVT